MNDAFDMRRIERVGNFRSQEEQHIGAEWLAGNQAAQGHAVQEFHSDERAPGLLSDFVDGANIWMIQSRGGLSFALETSQGVVIVDNFIGNELQRDKSAEDGVFRLVHHAHSAAAQLFQDAVVRNGLADKKLRVSHVAAMLVCWPRRVNESA